MKRWYRRRPIYFNKPLRIEDIARELGMSVSGFHARFRAVTPMSPLQFQKQLRLQESRRHKRHVGEPPIRDVERLRALARA